MVICSGRHHKPKNRFSSGSSIYKPTISDPIPMGAGGGMRTDFLRRTTGRAKSMFSTRSQISPKHIESHWKMPTPPVPNNIPAVPVGGLVTPERRLAHEPSLESIRVYSPSNNGTVQPPVPAAIAPLRGMAAQRYPPTNNMGSPFKTPPNNNYASTTEGSRANERGVSTISGISELSGHNDHEILSPARYGGDAFTPTRRQRPEGQNAVSRPTTTFTEMLHEAGFPDPIQDHGAPAVPKIPNGYSARNRI